MDSAEIRNILSHSTENLSKMVFECPEMEGFIESALDDTGKREKRKRSLAASFVVKFVITMMLFRDLSIVNIMRKFIHIFREFFRELTLISITPEALCHARKRLGFEVLRILFEYIAAMVRPLAKFHNFPVVGVDGTKLNVPDTEANADFFGRPNVARDEAAHPRMEVITLVNTSTRQLTGVEIMPCNSSERDGFLKLFDKLPEKALVLVDRGFPAQWLLELLLDFSKHFVVRISDSWKPEFLRRLGDGDMLVAVQGRIPRAKRRGSKVTRRMVLRKLQYQIGEGKKVSLLTDLIDPEKYPARELVLLYHQRWDCEIAYDEFKTHLAATAGGAQDLIFRSKSPDGVLQEAYALFALYNRIRGIMAEAGKLNEINPLDISFVDSVQLIRENMRSFQEAGSDGKRRKIVSRMLRDMAVFLNPRPRRKRKYPRVVKKKMSNYNRKRKNCCQSFVNIGRDLKMVD